MDEWHAYQRAEEELSLTKIQTYLNGLRGKHIGILGYGVSNAPLARMFFEAGAQLTVYDQKTPEQLGASALQLEKDGVRFCCGEGYADQMNDEIIFRSPGFLPTKPALRRAAAAGAQITSEMSLFFECCPCPIIGITGSDGKSTTSTVTAKLLEQSGKRVWLGGNIGTPLTPKLDEMKAADYAVVELSSFQLMDMHKSPHIAIVTNVAPNHLDKHTNMAEYIEAKRAVFRYQQQGDLLAANFDNEITRGFLAEAPAAQRPFSRQNACRNGVVLEDGWITLRENGQSQPILQAARIKIPGSHNVENYMAAIDAVYELTGREAIQQVAETFGGVQHRLELVRTMDGVRYYNSSIDSSPTRTMAALSVFDGNLTVILGGSDKGISFQSLGDALCRQTKRIILTGATADAIEQAVRSAPSFSNGKPDIYRTPTLVEAVQLAHDVTLPGEIVLLSPACASFDAFRNFEERGEVFRKAVLSLQA